MSAVHKKKTKAKSVVEKVTPEISSEPARNWSHLPPPDQYVSPEEYFKILEESDVLLEWIDGVIYPRHDPFREVPQAMAGASDRHIDVHVELTGLMYGELKSKPCHLVTPDQMVKCGESYAFPDVTIYCGEREKDENGWLLNPVVIMEILSPRTSKYDKGLKWEKYREIKTLTDFFFVHQDKPLIEHYHRRHKTNKNHWNVIFYNRLEDEITITSVGARLKLQGIYARLNFPADEKTA